MRYCDSGKMSLTWPGMRTSALRWTSKLIFKVFVWSCLMDSCWPRSAGQVHWNCSELQQSVSHCCLALSGAKGTTSIQIKPIQRKSMQCPLSHCCAVAREWSDSPYSTFSLGNLLHLDFGIQSEGIAVCLRTRIRSSAVGDIQLAVVACTHAPLATETMPPPAWLENDEFPCHPC